MRAISVLLVCAAAGVTLSAQSPVAIDRPDAAAQAFAKVAAVFSSPRCANCHISGSAPLQGDDGHPHTMNVRRGSDGRGTPAMRCANCHQQTSAPSLHAPPGAPDWRLPPVATPMAWKGLTTGDQCRMLKDVNRNGNRTLADLLEHVTHESIVVAGWSPGPGRTLPPLSHDAFVKQFKAWIDLGATCPD